MSSNAKECSAKLLTLLCPIGVNLILMKVGHYSLGLILK